MSKLNIILDKWAEYSNYDSSQTSFNLLDMSHELHSFNKLIEVVISEYDNTGAIAVILCKMKFIEMMKKAKVEAWKVLETENILSNEKEMYALFNSRTVTDTEVSVAESINTVMERIIGTKMIGDMDKNSVISKAMESIYLVIKSLEGCNEDLYLRGGEMLPINNFNTNIHVFPSLASCLTTLEKVDDGLYLCYIDNLGSAEGYFGFYLKNNGNLLSINERIDEAYKGSHKNSRNGRWIEEKKENIFPYGFIFEYSDYDYKGYAMKHTLSTDTLIDNNGIDKQVPFSRMDTDAYMPIILAMIMIRHKYVGIKLDMNLKYVDTLLPINVSKALENKENALIIVDNSSIIKSHTDIDLNFDIDKVIDGSYSKEFHYQGNEGKSYKETGVFTDSNQLFVDLWGEGFTFDSKRLYETDSQQMLTNSSCEEYEVEFIGTKERVRLQGYFQVRRQLAQYIRQKIYEEFIIFGGIDAMYDWFNKRLQENIWNIESAAIKHYMGLKSGTSRNYHGNVSSADKSILYDIDMQENKKYPDCYWDVSYINNLTYSKGRDYSETMKDLRTGAICNTWFIFKPKEYKAFEELFKCDVPRILKGWKEDGHFGVGNGILNATDAVSRIGTPFERYEEQRNEAYHSMSFLFAIGFSKKGLKQAIKEHEKKIDI